MEVLWKKEGFQVRLKRCKSWALPDVLWEWIPNIRSKVSESAKAVSLAFVLLDFDQANAAHPKEPQEMFLFCLSAWCQKTDCQASKADLKKALQTYGRRDLVEMREEIDPDPIEWLLMSFCADKHEINLDLKPAM